MTLIMPTFFETKKQPIATGELRDELFESDRTSSMLA